MKSVTTGITHPCLNWQGVISECGKQNKINKEIKSHFWGINTTRLSFYLVYYL